MVPLIGCASQDNHVVDGNDAGDVGDDDDDDVDDVGDAGGRKRKQDL